MRILIADDSFIHRKVMLRLLSGFGSCDVAVDGQEAIDAMKMSLEENDLYNLVCLDITMPNVDGHEALRQIRQLENDHSIEGLEGVKVIMTTALNESENIFQAFRDGCEAYIVKPVTKNSIVKEMGKLGLLSEN